MIIKLLSLLFGLNFIYSQIEGCTDIEAYNCASDSIWSTYIFDVGGIMYDNSCNWDWDINSGQAIYLGYCESDPCEGYYNEEANIDDGSCRYYQAPDFDIIYNDDGIELNWSTFTPPENSDLQSYHIQKCTEQCSWIPGYTLSDSNTDTYVYDTYDWQNYEYIKYAIFVKYSSNPYWGWALNTKIIIPTEGCTDPNANNYDIDANIDDGSCILFLEQKILPMDLMIKNIYPNPFNPYMNIIYEISYPQSLIFKIYNLNGKLIDSINLGNVSAGINHFIWEPKNDNSSIYFILLDNGEHKSLKKVVLLK